MVEGCVSQEPGRRTAGRRAVLLAGLVFVSSPGRGEAQEPSPVPSPSPSPAATPALLRPPTVSGFLQIDERVGDDKTGKQPEHEFSVRRARVTLSGRVADRVAYTLTFQGDGANVNTASLLDGFAEVTFRPWIKARVGQYKYDFDLEGRENDSANPLPDRGFATNAVAGGLNGASTASNPAGSFRDRGVTFGGTSTQGSLKWSYGLGLFQGTGRASDNNSKPAYTLNTSLEPRPGLILNLGLLSSDTAASGATIPNTYRAWTVGGSIERHRLFARGEYYRGQRETAGTDQDLKGFYVVGVFAAVPRLDLVGRYHVFQDRRFPAGDDHMYGVDLGVKYYFDRRDRRSGTFVVATYSIRNADAGVTSGLTLLNDGRGAALENGRDVANALTVRLQVRF